MFHCVAYKVNVSRKWAASKCRMHVTWCHMYQALCTPTCTSAKCEKVCEGLHDLANTIILQQSLQLDTMLVKPTYPCHKVNFVHTSVESAPHIHDKIRLDKIRYDLLSLFPWHVIFTFSSRHVNILVSDTCIPFHHISDAPSIPLPSYMISIYLGSLF